MLIFKYKIAKTWEGFEVLSHLKAKKLNCHSFRDALEDIRSLGQRKKITMHGPASSMSISIFVSVPLTLKSCWAMLMDSY